MLLVSDDPLARAGLAALLPDEVLVVEALPTDADLGGAVQRSGAAAVLYDGGAEVPARRRLDLEVPVLLLVTDEEQARRGVERGAGGVLLRDADGPRLAAALRGLVVGLRCLDSRLGGLLPEASESAGELAEPLTPREEEVLQLLAEGLSNRRLARELDISVHTAKFHVDRILLKLDASSRTDAVVRAVRLGLLRL